VETCSLDAASATATVGNRLQPFVTVGNRPQVGRYGRAYGEFCTSCHFWIFLEVSNVAKLRFAWHAWLFVTFQHVSSRVENRFECFASFSEDELQFSWQAQHFGVFHRHFAWQEQHFRRVVLRVCG
jgi:hypothetical protein